jgi:hypothetical protein
MPATATTRSPAAAVVSDVDVVVVPLEPVMVLLLLASKGDARAPLYSAAVAMRPVEPDAPIVTDDSVPSEIFQKRYTALSSTTDGPAV